MHDAHCGDLLKTVRHEENCQSDPRSSCLYHQNEMTFIYHDNDDHAFLSGRGIEMEIAIDRLGS